MVLLSMTFLRLVCSSVSGSNVVNRLRLWFCNFCVCISSWALVRTWCSSGELRLSLGLGGIVSRTVRRVWVLGAPKLKVVAVEMVWLTALLVD